MKARAKVVEGLVSDTRVVVATMDALCKHRAGLVRGVAKGVLEGLNMKVALCDESEAHFMGQALAGLAGGKSFETLLFFGDENQRLEDFSRNPVST